MSELIPARMFDGALWVPAHEAERLTSMVKEGGQLATKAADMIERLERELAEARGLLREASEEWIDPHAYDRVLPEFADKCRAFMARIDAFLTADVSHSSQNGAGLSRTVDAEQSPLDRMADNARELGLDYTPADQPDAAQLWKPYRIGGEYGYWQCATPSGPYNFQAADEAAAIAVCKREKAAHQPPVAKVGCEREDGTLNIHAETETCEVCQPKPVNPQESMRGASGFAASGQQTARAVKSTPRAE